ncbi:MAG TPA: rhomboid family intramembrane serine protease [Pyrinomonadaceae bacterium]|nr:rhomboid family intramembrane serine protease [Pyrinomonadaceae bacterium]
MIPSQTVPIATIGLIAINGLVFLHEFSLVAHSPAALDGFIEVYGFIPSAFTIPTMVSSMFLHGSWMHLFGNMLSLWIFGDNIEDRLGHVKYLIFYLLCGVIASLAHVFTTGVFANNESALLVPSLGASGAISGVLGGYLLLHPKRRVTVILFRFLTDVPAYVAIGIWFAFQLISGLGMLGGGSQQGGVAYAAHIGGFIAGLVLIKFFDRGGSSPRAPAY